MLSEVTPAQREEAKAFIKTHECKVYNLDSPCNLHIVITLVKGDDTCEVEIKDLHNNIVKVVKNGKVLLEKKQDCKKYCGALTPRDSLNFERIYDYAKTRLSTKFFQLSGFRRSTIIPLPAKELLRITASG